MTTFSHHFIFVPLTDFLKCPLIKYNNAKIIPRIKDTKPPTIANTNKSPVIKSTILVMIVPITVNKSVITVFSSDRFAIVKYLQSLKFLNALLLLVVLVEMVKFINFNTY